MLRWCKHNVACLAEAANASRSVLCPSLLVACLSLLVQAHGHAYDCAADVEAIVIHQSLQLTSGMAERPRYTRFMLVTAAWSAMLTVHRPCQIKDVLGIEALSCGGADQEGPHLRMEGAAANCAGVHNRSGTDYGATDSEQACQRKGRRFGRHCAQTPSGAIAHSLSMG